MSEQISSLLDSIALAANELETDLGEQITIPVPESFTINSKNYLLFISYIQNWGQTLQSWGYGYDFMEVALPNLDATQPTSGNSDLDNALLQIAEAISQNNQINDRDETAQWRMRAMGGKYEATQEILNKRSLKTEQVKLMDTHCWLPIIGDNNLDIDSNPGCLENLYQSANRDQDTAKACYVKLPANQDVSILKLPEGYPSELVTAGAKLAVVSPGSSMLEFSEGLAAQGYYLCVPTAPGILSVGGVVAIAGHGSGVPSTNSDSLDIPHYAFSTVSNQLVWIDVIAYNESSKKYELKRVARNDSTTAQEWSAMACGLGKFFAVRMAFLVYPLEKDGLKARILQINHFINSGTLLGTDGTKEGSLQYLAQNYGGFEPIQFPTYNDNFYEGKDFVWTKTWSYHPKNSDFTDIKVFHKKNIFSHQTISSNLGQDLYNEATKPYNYPKTAGIPCAASVLIVDGVRDLPSTTPILTTGSVFLTGLPGVTGGGIFGSPSSDKTAFWSDKNLNVYYFVEPDTLRAYDWSYGVLCRMDQIQEVVHIFHTESLQLLQSDEFKDKYPLMTAGEIRLVGLDNPPDPNWSYPALSTASPGLLAYDDNPTDMVCVYLSWLSAAVQPDYWSYCSALEDILFFNDDAKLGAYSWAPEWSKAWGCNEDGPYKDDSKLARVRENFNNGTSIDAFNNVTNILNSSDPHKLFYSKMIARLFEI